VNDRNEVGSCRRDFGLFRNEFEIERIQFSVGRVHFEIERIDIGSGRFDFRVGRQRVGPGKVHIEARRLRIQPAEFGFMADTPADNYQVSALRPHAFTSTRNQPLGISAGPLRALTDPEPSFSDPLRKSAN
jgi:hypothetical protein